MNRMTSSLLIGLIVGTGFHFLFNENLRPIGAEGSAISPLTSSSPVPNFVELSKALRPTVVNVIAFHKVRRRRFSIFADPFFSDPFGRQPSTAQSTGSGVFIDAQGHIATNNHVIDGAIKIVVTLHDGTQSEAQLVGQDLRTDLAVLKIKKPIKHKYASFSKNIPEVGSWVIAIGSPLRLDQSVTKGIISALGRDQVSVNRNIFAYANFIQTDAAINPGNSGGPLINMKGEVIGINTAIASETGGFQGIGLAIPATLCSKICRDLIKHGHVPYPWLGAVLANYDELSNSYLKKLAVDTTEAGIVLLETWKSTPAHKSKLQADDVILKFNGKVVSSTDSFRYELSQLRPGETVPFLILRKGKKINLNMVLEERPSKVRDSTYFENTQKVVD